MLENYRAPIWAVLVGKYTKVLDGTYERWEGIGKKRFESE